MNYLDLEDRLYTSTEVARILGVSLRSVYRYLEDNKLDAEIKTATGRHRFTKQNILDFLSPQGSRKTSVQPSNTSEKDVEVSVSPNLVSRSNTVSRMTELEEDKPEPAAAQRKPQPKKLTPIVEDEEDTTVEIIEEKVEIRQSSTSVEDDEEVDWLAKFRAAAEKYKAEVKAAEEPVVETRQAPKAHVSELTSFVDEEEVEEPVAKKSSSEYYYTSSVGGLKDIAQNLDKSATKASLDYAFTMDAGLSLHKPIRPFSLIHAYVRSEDLPFFEKILGLSQVDKSDAQLCLIASDDNELFQSAVEVHGLKVVSDAQLKADLISEGKADLAKELS
uniref:DNA-binding protein n=1 Tax=candidate division WWE3 bacterium TaxID=2053526 RepID=A0A7C4XUX8_UNCKA